jgi:uncharacterized protein YbaR (Trm112 family)
MALDAALLKILACPVDKGSLLYFAADPALYNPRLRRRYRVSDGVPELLVQEAEAVGGDEHSRLMDRAQAGEAVQTLS